MADWAPFMLFCFPSFLSLVTSQPLVPEFQPLCTSFSVSAPRKVDMLHIHDPAYEAWMLVTAVWRAVHMAWTDLDLSRCIEDPRSLGFPARSSSGNNKLGLGVPGSCLLCWEVGSSHTPRICRVLTVGMRWLSWAARGYWGLWLRYPHSSAVLLTSKEEILPV